MNYAAFYELHLGKIKWGSKAEGMARCPFHEDKTASLAVNRSRGLWFCHACAEGGSARQFAERCGADPPPQAQRDPEAVHVYTDEHGKPLFRVVRLPGKKFHQERYLGAGQWAGGLGKTRRVPYHLHRLVKTSGLIVIPEGEKDVHSLERLGVTASTNPMGAGKWRPEYNAPFRGRPVAILADNDEPGRRHAHDVARQLHAIAASVKLLEFPELPEHGDVSDAIARGLAREQLLARVERAPDWSPARMPAGPSEGPTLGELWPGRIPEEFRGLRLPAGYTVSAAGLHTASGHLVTRTAILPVAHVQDLDTQRWSYDVLLVHPEGVRLLRVGAQDLADTRRIIGLTAQGVEVTSLSARGLVEFLTAYLRANCLQGKRETRRLGFVRWDGGAAYVLHEVQPASARIHYPADTEETRQLKTGLVPVGDLAGVAGLVQALLPYAIPLVTLCAAVAPAVRELLELDAPSFLLYLAAESSSGKTISQQIALSAWADPFNPAWLAHGHVTYAGFEAFCTRSNGLPLVVEDLQLFREDQRDDLLYAIGNERFKGRGGERARIQTPWRGVVIASGELHFLGEETAAGAGARIITLEGRPFREVTQRRRGFLTETVLPALHHHHGILGPQVVRRLLGLPPSERETLRAACAGRRDHLAKRAGANAILARQADQWALLALTGTLIGDTLQLQTANALEEAVFAEFERAQERPPQDQVRYAYEYMLSWALSNRPFFYVRTPEGTTDPGAPSSASSPAGIGEKETAPKEGRPVYGLINVREGWVAFYTNVLRDVLARANLGSAERLLRAWRDRGWLIATGAELTHSVKIAGQVPRLYVLKQPEVERGTNDVP